MRSLEQASKWKHHKLRSILPLCRWHDSANTALGSYARPKAERSLGPDPVRCRGNATQGTKGCLGSRRHLGVPSYAAAIAYDLTRFDTGAFDTRQKRAMQSVQPSTTYTIHWVARQRAKTANLMPKRIQRASRLTKDRGTEDIGRLITMQRVEGGIRRAVRAPVKVVECVRDSVGAARAKKHGGGAHCNGRRAIWLYTRHVRAGGTRRAGRGGAWWQRAFTCPER